MLSANVESYPCIIPPMAECLKVLHLSANDRLREAAQIVQEIREVRDDQNMISEDEMRHYNLQVSTVDLSDRRMKSGRGKKDISLLEAKFDFMCYNY